MATDVILPALGMSQDTGKILQWLKREGEQVAKGEPLVEIETDKATVEIEAPADGILARVSVAAGDDVPVGQVIAAIFTPDEVSAAPSVERPGRGQAPPLPYDDGASRSYRVGTGLAPALAASPKARRLAREQGKDLATIKGRGPEGAVLAADVLAVAVGASSAPGSASQGGGDIPTTEMPGAMVNRANELVLSNIWRIMAERTTQSWKGVPHFNLVREVNASRLIAWREQILKRLTEKVTYSDLLVRIVAAALRLHPHVNASWNEGKITLRQEINIGVAVAVEGGGERLSSGTGEGSIVYGELAGGEFKGQGWRAQGPLRLPWSGGGLVVPVIRLADTLSLGEIAQQREELVKRATAGKLRPQDISNGTFTISNLGMYNVDAFNAIINSPQAAILAVGRIAERVVPVNGQPAVQPMVMLTLSCDHRVVDGARGAQFLDTVATLIEEPLGLLG